MKWEHSIRQGVFLKRYKRFFADVQIGSNDKNQEVVVAHVANTGSMKSCSEPNSACLISHINDPARKLQFSLEAIQAPSGSWVGVNTSRPNKLAAELFREKPLAHWKAYPYLYSEVKISDESRVDLVLSKVEIQDRKKLPDPKNLHFVEIKNVSLADGDLKSKKGRALFPDAVTTRGQKHIQELMDWMAKGASCEFLFTVQRDDCESFSTAKEIDPQYAALLKEASLQGLIITPLCFQIHPEKGISAAHFLKVQDL